MEYDHFLSEKGFRISPNWTQQWQESAQNNVLKFAQKSVSAKQELLYQEALHSNLHTVGKQALPAELQVAIQFLLRCGTLLSC